MGSRVKFAALLLLTLCLISLLAGCTIHPPPPTEEPGGLKGVQPTGTPIQDITGRIVPKVSLDDVIAGLPAAEQEAGPDVKGMTISQIWGYGVDSAGLARTWVLGLQGGGKTTLLTYTEGAYKVLDLPASLPQGDVKIKELISPQDLFRRNLNTIIQEMNRLGVGEADLALDGKTYQIIIHSAKKSSILSFDAKTGELISSS